LTWNWMWDVSEYVGMWDVRYGMIKLVRLTSFDLGIFDSVACYLFGKELWNCYLVVLFCQTE
jgi:hypothetical protein